MSTYLNLLSLIPAIITAIKAIEAAIPEGGVGKQKLEAVIEIITALDSSFTQAAPQIATIIGILVKLFNSTGVFKK